MSRRHGLIGASKPYLYKEEDAEFYYRQTSGGVIMNNNPLVGSIDKIKGQTIAWNQLLENGDFSTTTGWSCGNSTLTVSGNILTVTVTSEMPSYTSLTKSFPTQAHKYYYRCNIKHPYTTNINLGIFGNTKTVRVTANTWMGISGISNITTEQTTKRFNFQPNNSSVLQVGDIVQLSYVSVYDLTLIYGEGDEPSTPEEFEADYQRWFGKPLTYEPYDEGSLRNVQMEGIKTTFINASPQTKSFNVTTLTGKLNGEGESVFIFHDGMKGVNDVKDEIYIEDVVTKAVKRIGSRAYQSGDESNSNVITDGTITYYELAEPQVYVLDTPLPIAYNCEAGGTEQILPENSGTPTSIAPIMDITYKNGQINN